MDKDDCRKCKWYVKADPYDFGYCYAPTPAYLYDPGVILLSSGAGRISRSENYAADCEVYEARDDA